ncbi:MAG: hypothetical protein HQM07_04290 [Zetaproteobacteria bacterium]|nr:hypothetical protein [Zetaproteobacteria bacterium]
MMSRFQKEISLILLLKVLVMGVIWMVWFSDPPTADVVQHLGYESPIDVIR